MPRPPRAFAPGVPVHIIQRGNNRTTTFRAHDDFARYRAILCEVSQRFKCAIHAYVLMSNHVHLLATPEDELGPSMMMQALGRPYVRYVNTRYQRTGTLFEGRFHSSAIDSDRYLIACSRYIELNPVRAGMVGGPDQYQWSSYCHNAYAQSDALVTHHDLYQRLGSTAPDRQQAYRALFRDPLDRHTLETIRRATSRGAVLGDAAFCDQLEARLGRAVRRMTNLGAEG